LIFIFKYNFHFMKNYFNSSGRFGLAYFLLISLLINIVSPVFSVFDFTVSTVDASYSQDDNNGVWSVDFTDNGGVKFQSGVNIDNPSGTVSVNANSSGYVVVGDITPVSFSAWKEVFVDGSWNDNDDVLVSLYDCSGVAIGDNSNFQNQHLSAGKFDISSLDVSTYSCLQVRVDLSDIDTIVPVVNEVTINWAPLPVFMVSLTGDDLVQVGTSLVYSFLYSLSYSDDSQVVAWLPMPTAVGGSYHAGYGQDVVLDGDNVVSISNSGQYTAIAIVVNGVDVPANSVYWDLGNVSSGTTDTLTVKLKTDNGLEDGLKYEGNAHIDSLAANEVISDVDSSTAGNQPFVTEVNSVSRPYVEKNVSGTIDVGNSHYLYNGWW